MSTDAVAAIGTAGGGEVLRGDQLDGAVLPVELVTQDRSHLDRPAMVACREHRLIRRPRSPFTLANPGVASAFEGGTQDGIE